NFSLRDPEHYPFNDLFISLVDACNLDCAYCFNKTARKRRLRQRPPTKLQPQTIIRAMEEFKALGGSGVCFTGGEPTLDPLLLDYCAAGKKIGLATRFITNGTMLSRLDAAKLVDAVDNFAVSLDTLDQAVASQLWGVVRFSVRETILYPLKRVCDTAKARGRDTFGVTIKPIVASANLNTLQPMVAEVSALLAGYSVSWDFSQFEPIGDAGVDQALGISEDTYNKAMVSCVRTLYPEPQPSAADGEGPSDLDKEHAILRLVLGHGGKVQPRREIKVMPCAPSFFVIGSGDVYPCQELETDTFRLGNISDTTLREMFHHPAFAALRSKMTVDDVEVCNECEFRYVCGRHCHGQAQQQFGRTTAYIHGNRDQCRRRMITQLWLETRGH
ncbi:MAG: radical SAM protein, partial [Chloroflexota bacterium]|nr:radical SAM protein [Chloroflexota bacterium]